MKFSSAAGVALHATMTLLMAMTVTVAAVRVSAAWRHSTHNSPDQKTTIVLPNAASHQPEMTPASVRSDGLAVSGLFSNGADPANLLHDLPEGCILIIGSLDQSGSLHTVQAEPAERPDDFSHGIQPPVSTHYHEVIRTLASCNERPPSHPPAEALTPGHASRPDEPPRRFLIPRFTDSGARHDLREAACIHRHGRVAVYASQRVRSAESLYASNSGVQPVSDGDFARQISTELCADIIYRVESDIGPIADVDQNECVTVVLGDLDLRRLPPDIPIYGCVRSSDFLDDCQPFGGDIIYLDYSLAGKSDLRAVLAHELAHAAVYSALLRQQCTAESGETGFGEACPDRRSMFLPSWMNEAIAHAMERRLVPDSDNFRCRLRSFSKSPGLCPVVSTSDQLSTRDRRGGTRAAATLMIESLLPETMPLSALLNDPWDQTVDPLSQLASVRQRSVPEMFREWTLYTLSELLRASRLDPNVRLPFTLLEPGGRTTMALRGTSAVYLKTSCRLHSVQITATADSQLQLTIVLPEGFLPCSRMLLSPSAKMVR